MNCKKCKSDKLEEKIGVWGPHTKKVVCSKCNAFIKWGKCKKIKREKTIYKCNFCGNTEKIFNVKCKSDDKSIYELYICKDCHHQHDKGKINHMILGELTLQKEIITEILPSDSD